VVTYYFHYFISLYEIFSHLICLLRGAQVIYDNKNDEIDRDIRVDAIKFAAHGGVLMHHFIMDAGRMRASMTQEAERIAMSGWMEEQSIYSWDSKYFYLGTMRTTTTIVSYENEQVSFSQFSHLSQLLNGNTIQIL
jgi:hypothetical protein